MRLTSSTVGKLLVEIDRAVEAQATVIVEVDVESVEIGGGVDQTDITGLNEVIRGEEVLLVGADLHVVGSNGRLFLIWVVEALDVG